MQKKSIAVSAELMKVVDFEASPLVARVMEEVLKTIDSGQLAVDQHISVQALCAQFEVSRSPVRLALHNLAAMGVLRAEKNRGYFVAAFAPGEGATLPANLISDEALYMRFAEDRLRGALPERVTESELMRRYELTRSTVGKILDRASEEGWVTRRAGQGWDFQPVLASNEALAQSYRFRVAIEPAALLEPGFKVNVPAFKRARERISSMASADLVRMSRAEIFDVGSSFHEMLMRCSGNDFFVSALQRVNRLRRLVEYGAPVDPDRLQRECREHLVLMDMLEEGGQEEASVFMRKHLMTALRLKT